MRRIPLLALGVLLLGGCATKGDVRNLRNEMYWMRQHQDSVLLEIQRQNRLLLDSIRTTMQMTQDARGTTASQLRQFEQNVSQLGQLVGQVMGTLNRIEQRLTGLEQRGAGAGGGRVVPAPPPPPPPTPASGGGTAEQYYTSGMQRLNDGSFSTARLAFEQLIAEFPEHARAPEAQFQIGEAYYGEGEFEDAYGAFEQVAEKWPAAPRAAAALFRAGAVAEERRAFARARQYYTQVREKFPDSEEARQAQAKLRSLPR
jgi:tol-pal system protein YbgF